jgi:hypothetical protein
MGTVVHRALDGSPVTISTAADLDAPLTAFGFAFPAGRRVSQPFNLFPGSRCDELLRLVDDGFPEVEYRVHDEIELAGGRLRAADVRRPVATGGHRRYTFVAWEDEHASLSTALSGTVKDAEALYEALDFEPRDGSIAVLSPIDHSIRPLRCLKEVPGHGLLEISPRVPSVEARLPRAAGAPVAGGDLYGRAGRRQVFVLVTASAVVTVSSTSPGQDTRALAEDVRVEWGRRASRRVA